MHHIPWAVLAAIVHEAAPLLHAHGSDDELRRCVDAVERAIAQVKAKAQGDHAASLARLADSCLELAARIARTDTPQC